MLRAKCAFRLSFLGQKLLALKAIYNTCLGKAQHLWDLSKSKTYFCVPNTHFCAMDAFIESAADSVLDSLIYEVCLEFHRQTKLHLYCPCDSPAHKSVSARVL
jgi:hypothetical protein